MKRILNDCTRGMGKPSMGLRAEVASWLFLIPGVWLLGDSGTGMAWALVISAATGFLVLSGSLLASRHDGIQGENDLRQAA